MPEYSYERAITKINEHRKYSNNGNHQPVAAAKIMPKRVEFEAAKSKGLDPDKRIKSGSKAEKSGKNPALSTKPAKGQGPKVENTVVIKQSCHGGIKGHTSISDHRTTSTKNPALYTKPVKAQSPKVENAVDIKLSCHVGIKVPMSIPDHGTTSSHFIEKHSETYQHTKSTMKPNGGSLVIAEEKKYIKKEVIRSKLDTFIRK